MALEGKGAKFRPDLLIPEWRHAEHRDEGAGCNLVLLEFLECFVS